MIFFNQFCEYLSTKTMINKEIISIILMTVLILCLFSLLKVVSRKIISKLYSTERRGFFLNQGFHIILNIIEIIILLLIWNNYIKSFMTLISILSAAIVVALREVILNFFCGIYIKIKRPFKVEDRIQIDDIKGDVMKISALNFEILEVSTKDENGQSTGVAVNFPNSIVFSKPIRNVNKGFKYVWNELTINVKFDCDLVKNKQEIYKIINNIETIKNIPLKMKNEIKNIGADNRVFFNKYDPIIYTKLVDSHIELTVRYLMHPKKARFVESVIWNKIYLAYKDKKIDLYLNK